MIVKIRRCPESSASRRRKRSTTRRFFKRYLNKWRRRAEEGQVKNFSWS